MDVSSGDLRVPLYVARKMDEELYGFFYLLHCVQWRGTRMMGDKEDGMRSRLRVRFTFIALKGTICALSSSYNNEERELPFILLQKKAIIK